MSKWKSFLLILSLLIGLFLMAGCTPSTPQCADNALQQVTMGAPQNWEIVNSLTPVLNWTYPNPNCHPGRFFVDLASVENSPQNYSGIVDGTATSWSHPAPLLPGKGYEWTVTAMNGNVNGQGAPWKSFFIGPMCDPNNLHAPSLVYPYNNNKVTTTIPQLLWQNPDPCLQPSYRIDLSTDQTFSNNNIGGGTGNPSTNWGPAVELTDCSMYFWRVAAFNGSLGPYSEVNYFNTDFEDNCPTAAPAAIRGILWYDQCPVPLDANPAPNPLPEGCVVDSYGVDGDGIHQASEPYMQNIVVDMAPGDCPSAGTMHSITDAAGIYTFTGLTPGKYCLSVSASNFVGPAGDGHWTLVQGGHEGISYRPLLLAPGEMLGNQNFAWYQPAGAATPTATPTPLPAPFETPAFIPDFNINCHTGPGLNFDAPDVAMKGQSYPLDGRNQAGDWVRIMLTQYNGCWVMANTGSASADIAKLRVLISPPTPTPISVVDCASYKDEKSCKAQNACQWTAKPGIVPVNVCTNK